MVVRKPIFAKDRIVLALDCDTLEDAEKYVVMLKDYVGYFKVGNLTIFRTRQQRLPQI